MLAAGALPSVQPVLNAVDVDQAGEVGIAMARRWRRFVQASPRLVGSNFGRFIEVRPSA
jgi:hypothetical protein